MKNVSKLCINVSLYRCIVVSLYRCIVVSLYRCIVVSKLCIVVSLYRCIVVTIMYRFMYRIYTEFDTKFCDVAM